MKIGAGGLQGMIAQEASKGVEASRVKPPLEEALLQSNDPNLRRLLRELNKAVEKMRKTAELYNHPLDFNVKRGENPKIGSRDRRTGLTREFTLEEAEAWLEGVAQHKGRNIDGYA